MVQNSFLFNNVSDNSLLRPSRYFLDTAASHSTNSNTKHGTNLKHCLPQDILYATCNSGNMIFNQQVDLGFLHLTVHHNPYSVANVLSCYDLDAIPGAYVYHNGKVDLNFYLIFDSGRVIRFIHCDEGRMYYYDTDKSENHEMKMDGLNLA